MKTVINGVTHVLAYLAGGLVLMLAFKGVIGDTTAMTLLAALAPFCGSLPSWVKPAGKALDFVAAKLPQRAAVFAFLFIVAVLVTLACGASASPAPVSVARATSSSVVAKRPIYIAFPGAAARASTATVSRAFPPPTTSTVFRRSAAPTSATVSARPTPGPRRVTFTPPPRLTATAMTSGSIVLRSKTPGGPMFLLTPLKTPAPSGESK